MLTLFPGERPEYPEDTGHSLDRDNAAVFSLAVEGETARLAAEVFRGEQSARGESDFPADALDQSPEKVYHVVQHALKMAFYQAGCALLGQEPPWGALTGVRPVKRPTRARLAGATEAEAIAQLEREYRVSPVRAALAADCARATLAAQRQLGEKQVSVYVGIPFCPTRCAYCSFVSADVGRTLKLVEPYLQLLLEEVDATGRALREAGLTVRSFYMGGGTPTTLSADQLDRLLARCEQSLPLQSCIEYTVEAGRPDTITREKLIAIREGGGNRISVNPQTMSDPVLAAIGRSHRAQDIRRAYALARETGVGAVNMDLIAGLPADTPAVFRRTVEEVLAMAPENITVHTLALKKGARLRQEETPLPSGTDVAAMLDFAWAALRQAGYLPYYLYRQKFMSGSFENVGWCKPGFVNVYNICMMEELHTVLSLGAGGVTKLVEGGVVRRLANPKYPQEYLRNMGAIQAEKAAFSW